MGAWIETRRGSWPVWATTSHPVWVRGLKQSTSWQSRLHRLSHPVWVRGLKHAQFRAGKRAGFVAPRVGAWIETYWVRIRISISGSHPVWVRGLKLQKSSVQKCALQVAPRVGAWIETFTLSCDGNDQTVAPRVGAWIETDDELFDICSNRVAPRVGAWIETFVVQQSKSSKAGRTPCGCVD